MMSYEDHDGEWMEECIFGGQYNHCPIKKKED